MSEKNKDPHRIPTDRYYKSMEEFVREQEVKRLREKARAEEAAQAAAGGVVSLVDVVVIILILLFFICLLPLVDV